MLHNRFRITFSAACFTCCLAAFFLSACGAVNASAPTDAASPEPAPVPTPASTAYITLDAGAALYRAGDLAFEAVFMTDDGSVWITPGLAGRYQSDRPYQVLQP